MHTYVDVRRVIEMHENKYYKSHKNELNGRCQKRGDTPLL